MLKPAICYKEQLENALKPYYYTEDMCYFIGCNASRLLKIDDNTEKGQYQFAVTNKDDKLIGYIGFYCNHYRREAYSFGAFSFDRGNPIMGRDMYKLIETLIKKLHRVEFRAVEGNPAIKGYDKLLNKHTDIGRKIILRDETKDNDGNYRNGYIYEFVNPRN